MKTPLMILAAAAATFAQAAAAPLSPSQALSRARGEAPAKYMIKAQQTPRLLMTVEAAAQPACYVFTGANGNGYMVVSADDNAAPLLGYSDSGTIYPDRMPPALKYWLDEYSSQIAFARAAGAPAYKSVSRASRDAINPMVATRWNQDAPYNDLCPMDSNARSVTGCVATALAQVMKYHAYPDKGVGSNSYTCGGQTLSVNFADTEYRWSDMLDTYGADATEAQRDAVATLMYSCGVAVDMEYSSDESSAETVTVPVAMVEYFGYDKGIRYYSRDYYTLADWEQLIYDQLQDYGPVQYSGQSSEGGHSFVCDGYSSEGYFHINWGWGGMSDGYFLLDALDPVTQGIGGSTSGFNFDQNIVGNVSRPREGSSIYEQMVYNGDFAVADQSSEVGATIGVEGPVYNLSIAPISGTLGIKFTDTDGSVYYGAGAAYSNLARLSGYNEYGVTIPADLPDGTYTVTPAYRTSGGEWMDTAVPIDNVSALTASVSDGQVSFTSGTAPSISVTEVNTSVTPFYIGSMFEIQGVIVNNSQQEYLGTIVAALVDDNGEIVAYGDQYPVDVMSGTSSAMTYVSTFANTTASEGGPEFTPGEYTLYFVTSDLQQALSDGNTVTVNAAPEQTTVTVAGLGFEESERVSNNKDDMRFVATVNCTEGYFAGSLTLVIFPYSDGDVESVAEFTSDPVFIDQGDSSNVRFSGDFSQGTVGKKYMAMVYDGENRLSESPLVFTLDAPSGAASVITDGIGAQIYYTTSGVRVDDGNLAPGIYIVRDASGSHKVLKR